MVFYLKEKFLANVVIECHTIGSIFMDSSLENLIMTDTELAQLSVQSPDYFGVLMERYEKKIRRYVSRITHVTNADQDDIVQNTFVKAYVNINSFNSSLSFNSWIYRIAHNEVIDWSRKSKTRVRYGHVDHDDEIFDWTADTSHFLQELEVRDIAVNVNKILSQLDIQYREVIYLRYIEHYSYKDIGDILKKPEGTIATLINRAKKKFKNIYEKNN